MRHALPCALLLALTAPATGGDMTETLASLGGTPCQTSSLTCVTLTVPRDHTANDPDATLEITFAVSPAQWQSRGVLFYFVGGPGGSGLASAETYLASFDAGFTNNLDVVFVDQRGTGPVHGLACPKAQSAFDLAEVSLDRAEAAMAAARSYVTACTAEMDRDDLLPVVNSDQAIRDFELFRQAIGAPKVWLFGESYGTQIVQAYATAYPDAVRGVILDGVVDLNQSAEAFYATYTLAAERLLDRMLAECRTRPGCAEDMGRDAAAAYDDLAARTRAGTVAVDLVLADGTTAQRDLTSALLETTAFFALYSPEGRAEFLRVLAAAERGNLAPLLKLAYVNIYVDPQTLDGIADPGLFAAAYYAITCADYDSGPGTPDERAARIVDQSRIFAPNAPRLLRSYYLERLACAYWPHQGAQQRPEPFAGGNYPTIVLNSDADPITPISMAYSVLDNARNSYGIFMQGGPHVIWGRGVACPDAIVQALLYDGRLPAAREQRCQQDFIARYSPLTLRDQAQMADPLAVAKAVDIELRNLVELASWDGVDPRAVGCDLGGTVTASTNPRGTEFVLKDCSFWPGLAVSGSGTDDVTDGPDDGISLTLGVSGRHQGQLSYQFRRQTEAWSLTGTYDGKPASMTRTYP